MVKQGPTSMFRVVLAFTLTVTVAVLPLATMVAPFGSGYRELVLTAVPVVALASAVAVGTVVAGAQRRLRPARV